MGSEAARWHLHDRQAHAPDGVEGIAYFLRRHFLEILVAEDLAGAPGEGRVEGDFLLRFFILVAAELDAKRAIEQGTRLASAL